MQSRQQNHPNWDAHVFVYTPGCREYLTAYNVGQSWDGSRAHHERLMAALVEFTEGLADRTGLAYRIHLPSQVKAKRWAFRLEPVIEIERIPF